MAEDHCTELIHTSSSTRILILFCSINFITNTPFDIAFTFLAEWCQNHLFSIKINLFKLIVLSVNSINNDTNRLNIDLKLTHCVSFAETTKSGSLKKLPRDDGI